MNTRKGVWASRCLDAAVLIAILFSTVASREVNLGNNENSNSPGMRRTQDLFPEDYFWLSSRKNHGEGVTTNELTNKNRGNQGLGIGFIQQFGGSRCKMAKYDKNNRFFGHKVGKWSKDQRERSAVIAREEVNAPKTIRGMGSTHPSDIECADDLPSELPQSSSPKVSPPSPSKIPTSGSISNPIPNGNQKIVPRSTPSPISPSPFSPSSTRPTSNTISRPPTKQPTQTTGITKQPTTGRIPSLPTNPWADNNVPEIKKTDPPTSAPQQVPSALNTEEPTPLDDKTPAPQQVPSGLITEAPVAQPASSVPNVVEELEELQQEYCDYIERQNPVHVLDNEDDDPNRETLLFSIVVSVQYQENLATSEKVVEYLDRLNIPVALWISGCEERATNHALRITLVPDDDAGQRRRIQNEYEIEPNGFKLSEDTIVEYSEMEGWRGTGSICESSTIDTTCTSFASRVIVFPLKAFSGNEASAGRPLEEVFKDRIFIALKQFRYLVTGNPGVFFVDIERSNIRTIPLNGDDGGASQPNGIGGASGSRETSIAINSNAIIGSTVAGLGSLLLVMICILLCRRKRDDEIMKHSRFDDESEDYYTPEDEIHDAELDLWPSSQPNYFESRNEKRYVDTAISFDGSNRQGNNLRSTMRSMENHDDSFFGDIVMKPSRNHNDIEGAGAEKYHEGCSSPSCQICEERRRRGVVKSNLEWLQMLLPDGPERVPSYDPSRQFTSGDTVFL